MVETFSMLKKPRWENLNSKIDSKSCIFHINLYLFLFRYIFGLVYVCHFSFRNSTLANNINLQHVKWHTKHTFAIVSCETEMQRPDQFILFDIDRCAYLNTKSYFGINFIAIFKWRMFTLQTFTTNKNNNTNRFDEISTSPKIQPTE